MTIIDPVAPAQVNWLRLASCSLAEETQRLLSVRASRHRFEICGFIIGENEIVPAINTSDTPNKNFSIAPEETEKYGASITGIYHSHPSGFNGPSHADEEGMKFLYRAGCPWRYFIVTSGDVIEYKWIG